MHPYGILKGVVDAMAFVKGECGAEIVDVLAPQDGDVVIEELHAAALAAN